MGKLRSPAAGGRLQMVQGRHVDKAPDRLCRAPEGRSRALEGMSGGGVQLTERRNFLTAQSGPAQWAAWGSLEAACALEVASGQDPAQAASRMAGFLRSLLSLSPRGDGIGRNRSEWKRDLGLKPSSLPPEPC